MCLSLAFKDPAPPSSSSPSLRNRYFSAKLVSPNYIFLQIKISEEKSLIKSETEHCAKCIVPVDKSKDCGMRMPLYNWTFKYKTMLLFKIKKVNN